MLDYVSICNSWKACRDTILSFYLKDADALVKTASAAFDETGLEKVVVFTLNRCDTVGKFLFADYLSKNASLVSPDDEQCDSFFRESFAHYLTNVKRAGFSLANDRFASEVLGEKNCNYLDKRIDADLNRLSEKSLDVAPSAALISNVKQASVSIIDRWKSLPMTEKLITLLGIPLSLVGISKFFTRAQDESVLPSLAVVLSGLIPTFLAMQKARDVTPISFDTKDVFGVSPNDLEATKKTHDWIKRETQALNNLKSAFRGLQ